MKANEISRRLAERADRVAEYLLPNGKRVGREWKAGNTRGDAGESLSVCVSGARAGLWADFSTDEKGDLLDLWAACRGIGIGEAIREAKDFLGIQDDRRYEPRKEYTRPAKPKVQSAKERVRQWLNGRGIEDATIEAFRIAQLEQGGKIWAVFPYLRDGEYINGKYRNIYEKRDMRQEAGAEPCLFGWHLIDSRARMVAICEGEIDAMSVHQAGIPALSVNQGAGNHQWLDSDWERLQQFSDIVVCYDSDEPGRKGAAEVARRLGVERCRMVEWPVECKDANDVLLAHGPKTLSECINAAAPIPIEGTCEVMTLMPDIQRHYSGEVERGVSTGWANVDKYYTVLPGEWTVVTGIPGHGKSEWLDALAMNIAKQHGWTFGVFSPENHPPVYHTTKLVEKYVGKPFHDGPTERVSAKELHGAMEFIDAHFTYMMPEAPTLETLLEQASQLVVRKGIKGLIIDPWNEIEHQFSNRETETLYISTALTKIRRFCWTHGVHAWIVAHPAKLYKDKDATEYPVPTPYDIAGSAHWRNKADNAIAIYRRMQDGPQPVEVHVQKIRKKSVGQVGMIEMRYDRLTGRYYPWNGVSVPVYSGYQAQEKEVA